MSKNELRSSGERRRRAFANGAGELSQCCRPRFRSFEKSLTLSLNPTIISSGMANELNNDNYKKWFIGLAGGVVVLAGVLTSSFYVSYAKVKGELTDRKSVV